MIPFFDLETQQQKLKQELDNNIAKVLSHGQYILGPEVAELEKRLCEYTGADYCITCANGTDALQLALMAIGVVPGDEIILPAFSYIATAEAAALLGAKPVYVDIDPLSFNINPELIEEKVTAKTKAIIPVSLYGQPADFQEINRIAERHGLTVIEDAAQSFGASYNNQKSCNLSHIACTSFFPTKPLGCYGDGGAIFTSDSQLAKKLRMISRHGQTARYQHEVVGINSRLDTIQAAVLLAKLPVLDEEISARDNHASTYNSFFAEIQEVSAPITNVGVKSAWAQYTIRVKSRNGLMKFLSGHGVPTSIHYPKPLYEQKALKEPNDCRFSKDAANNVLSLPISATLTTQQIAYISKLIIQFTIAQ